MIPMNTARRRALAGRRGEDVNASNCSEPEYDDSVSFSSLSNASSSPSDECSSMMRRNAEVILLQSTSVSEEAHEELDQLMDKFREDEVEPQTASGLTYSRDVITATVSADLSRRRDRDKDGDEREGGITRKVLQLKQQQSSTFRMPSISRMKGKAVNAAMLVADDPSTVTNSSQGQKSAYTNATGYTDGTGTTAHHGNTFISKMSHKLRWKRRGGNMTGVNEILSIPESISMKGSDEMDSKLIKSVLGRDNDVISPTEMIMLAKRKLSQPITGQTVGRGIETTSTPFILGFVQNMFDCCSPIAEDESVTSMPKRHILQKNKNWNIA